MQQTNFSNFTLPTKPNFYLAAPKGACSVSPQEITPSFSENVANLKERLNATILNTPRVSVWYEEPTKNQYGFIARSKLFRFPDFIEVQYLALDDKLSSVIIYSRAKYGYSDLGVNKKRIQTWLETLTGSAKGANLK